MINRLIEFLKEVRLELKKVNWLSREETFRYTLIVIGVSFAVAIFLGLIDFLLNRLINEFILK
jgi:preprotein translocase subunit SecE